VLLVPGWSRCFSCNLDASSSDDCFGRWESRITSFILAWSNKEEANNQHLLLKLSTDMPSAVEVEKYLSVSSSSWSGRQLKTGAFTTWGIGLKAELKFGYWNRSLFSYWRLTHLPCRNNDLQHDIFVPSRSLECQKEGAYLFHGIKISKFSHSFHRLYVEAMLYLDP